ncbi:unnamed protein product [Parnassius mnemosyne]|uniref:Peptidase S1 domain-containing protein n=1 Tax=Parnassius mnemosyne TaxID=213953 RepID=A0AAV1LQ38_9NEOP
MHKCLIILPVIFNLVVSSAFREDVCEKCVHLDNCPQFNNMNRDEQQRWIRQFPCQQPKAEEPSPYYGFAPVARGDYVCCPGLNVWSIVNEDQGDVNKSPYDQEYVQPGAFNNRPGRHPQYTNNFPPYGGQNFDNNHQSNIGSNIGNNHNLGNHYPNYEKPDINNQKFHNRPNFYKPDQQNDYPKQTFPMTKNPQMFVPNGQQPSFSNQYPPCPTQNNFGYQSFLNNLQNPNCNSYQPSFNPTQQPPTQANPGRNNPPKRPVQNVFPVYPTNQGPNFHGVNGNGNIQGGTKLNNQCQGLTSLPPDPASGCCGLDMSSGEGITDLQIMVTQRIRNSFMYMRNNRRTTRQTENVTVGIDLDNRIAGGTETELNQFPWTVLLKTTFDYGTNKTSFNCGGSLISSKYVLTAAHCIHEKDATLSSVEITLAEYDKRTFPRDCKLNFGGEKTCIENVIIYAENIVPHPEYDDKKLYNDIALIRLRGKAPYTEFIRPICLPPLNVDNQVFYDLPLPVAGWGRNGPYMSDIKQSTVVNLVPHDECQQYYPYLSASHLCAAGKTGEDTCKGDSGGPLMMLYDGKYYVIGVVSGKRADAPCGTAVPSLYTNVFQYIDWIRNNIVN